MDNFVRQENIRRYRKLASASTDSTERSQIMKLLAEEQAKLMLETRRRDDASERRPPVNAATENRVRITERSDAPRASRKVANQPANRLLGLLSPGDYKRLRPHLYRIALEYRQSLYRAHKPVEFVYFIETGVGSR